MAVPVKISVALLSPPQETAKLYLKSPRNLSSLTSHVSVFICLSAARGTRQTSGQQTATADCPPRQSLARHRGTATSAPASALKLLRLLLSHATETMAAAVAAAAAASKQKLPG